MLTRVGSGSCHADTEKWANDMTESILVADHGNWVEITLNRPDKLNSFNEEMHLALRAALEGARDGGARAETLEAARLVPATVPSE